MRLAVKIQDAKNSQKFAIWVPSHNFVRLYLRNCTIDNRKKLVKQQYLPYMAIQYGELRPTIAAQIASLVLGEPHTAANFNGFRVLAALLHGIVVVGVSQTLRL